LLARCRYSGFGVALDLRLSAGIYSADADSIHTAHEVHSRRHRVACGYAALKFQGTKNKKIIDQIAGLNRLLAKMDARSSDLSQPKNRQ
jgi:hypothetical protein